MLIFLYFLVLSACIFLIFSIDTFPYFYAIKFFFCGINIFSFFDISIFLFYDISIFSSFNTSIWALLFAHFTFAASYFLLSTPCNIFFYIQQSSFYTLILLLSLNISFLLFLLIAILLIKTKLEFQNWLQIRSLDYSILAKL